MRTLHLRIGIAVFTVLLSHVSVAQKNKQPNSQQGAGQGNNPAGAAPSSPLPGLSWTADSWGRLTPPTEEQVKHGPHRIFLCYKLSVTTGPTQPFVLEPVRRFTDYVPPMWAPCANLNEKHPLLMRELLVLAIDARGVPVDSLKLLNFNLTNQQGAPLNPSPVRPSFGASATGGAAPSGGAGGGGPATHLGGVYYLTWPQQLPGDSIPTVSINVVYTPLLPGAPWSPNTFYPTGTVITSKSSGHFYSALNGGVSGSGREPRFPPPGFKDGTVWWLDSGSTAPTNAPAPPSGVGGAGAARQLPNPVWAPSATYQTGDVIFDPMNGHYYTALNHGQSGTAPNDPFPLITQTCVDNSGAGIYDGTLLWQDVGDSAPAGGFQAWAADTDFAQNIVVYGSNSRYYKASNKGHSGQPPSQPLFPIMQMCKDTAPEAPPGQVDDADVRWQDNGTTCSPDAPRWEANHSYPNGTVIRDDKTGHCYRAINPVTQNSGPGPEPPAFVMTPTLQRLPEITWVDSGTVPPGAVASGQPADQVVNILNFTFPQVHSLYYYNIASGIVVSSIRTATFGFTTDGKAKQTGSNLIVDPVLLFTAYIKPIDAERPYRLQDAIPGVSFGLSLSSPASNFYFGGSSEILRNIQLAYGFTIAKTSKLAPAGTFNPTPNGTNTPATTQSFSKGGFVGLTFNISGFLQGLFGGGGKGSQ